MNNIVTIEDRLGAEMAMMYCLADMLEAQQVIVDDLAKRCGFKIRQELRSAMNKMIKGGKDFRSWSRREQRVTQLMIGTCSDVFLQFLRLMVDRTEKDMDMYNIYCLVKNTVKSKRNWPLSDTEADAFYDIMNDTINKEPITN